MAFRGLFMICLVTASALAGILSEDKSESCDGPRFQKALGNFIKNLGFAPGTSPLAAISRYIQIFSSENKTALLNFCNPEKAFVKAIGKDFDGCLSIESLMKNLHLEKNMATVCSLDFSWMKFICGKGLQSFLKSHHCYLAMLKNLTVLEKLGQCGIKYSQKWTRANCSQPIIAKRCCPIHQWWMNCKSDVFELGCGKDAAFVLCNLEIPTFTINWPNASCHLTCPTPSPDKGSRTWWTPL